VGNKEMKVLIGGRRSGKTTECIKQMRENPDALMFVVNTHFVKNLPKDIQHQAFSINSLAWIGRPFKKVVIDEPDFMKDEVLERVTQCFDLLYVAGSLGKSYDHPYTWFRKTWTEYGYELKPTVDSNIEKLLSPEQYEREFLAKFLEGTELAIHCLKCLFGEVKK